MSTHNIYIFEKKKQEKLSQNPHQILYPFLTLVLQNPDMSCLYKQCRSRSEEAKWSGTALFVIKYANLHEQRGSGNLIGWQLEVGVAS